MMELRHQHISWGPEAVNLSAEERQQITDDLIAKSKNHMEQYHKAADSLAGLPFVAVPIDQLASIYERMLRLTKLGQATIEEWIAMPDSVRDLKHKIFEQSDFGAVYAGQWLPREIRSQTNDKVKGGPSPTDHEPREREG